jgi:hypothetical protein
MSDMLYLVGVPVELSVRRGNDKLKRIGHKSGRWRSRSVVELDRTKLQLQKESGEMIIDQ